MKDERLRRCTREGFAEQRLTNPLIAPPSRGEELAVCASEILLAPMFLEALTLHRVIVFPMELSALSTALDLEWGLDINYSFPLSPEVATLVNSTAV